MGLTLRSARRDFSEDHPWPTAEMKLLAELEQHSGGRLTNIAGEPPPAFATSELNPGIRPSGSHNERLSLRKRTTRALTRFLIIFGMGVATTLAWQSRGNEQSDDRKLISAAWLVGAASRPRGHCSRSSANCARHRFSRDSAVRGHVD